MTKWHGRPLDQGRGTRHPCSPTLQLNPITTANRDQHSQQLRLMVTSTAQTISSNNIRKSSIAVARLRPFRECVERWRALRKASMVQAAQKMLTDTMAAQAMRPAAKRSSTIQISDRNMPAARPAICKLRGCTSSCLPILLVASSACAQQHG